MTARALSTATVSFGLVSIPVKLYASGESSSAVRFHLLHEKCGSRLKQQYVCPKDGEIVGRDEMVKGYEFARGQYVLFSDEELKALQQPASQSIDIHEFLPLEKVDPLFFEKGYYVGPDKGGDRAYRLLARALAESGLAALAKYAARGKQYLVLLRSLGDALVMQQLRYADEVRSVDEVPTGGAEVNDAELELARQIIDQARSEAFRPEQYEDDVRKRIVAAIENKVEGREIREEPTEEPRAQVIDLMEALKASLASRSETRKPAKRAPRAAAKRAGRGKAAKKRSKG